MMLIAFRYPQSNARFGANLKPLFVVTLFACLLGPLAFPVYGDQAGPWTLRSPDGTLCVVVTLVPPAGPESGQAGLFYRVLRTGKDVLPDAPLGIRLQRLGAFQSHLQYVGESTRTIDEPYIMPVGKRRQCRHRAQELTLDFANADGARFSVLVRAADDGIAYCYRIHGSGQDSVVGEASSFVLPPGSRGWLSRYTAYYESDYEAREDLAAVRDDLAMPALFRTPNAHWVLVTEADVDGRYAGAHLRFADTSRGLLSIQLPEQPCSTLPWTTPWRVAIIGSELKTLVESTLVADLNPPSEIADTTWIQPGVDVIPWMTGPATNNMSLDRMKQFVDLAREMGWTWIEFDNALALGNQGADAPEKWMAIPWIPTLVKYAASQGIHVYGWDHWRNLDTPEKREHILGYFVRHGFKGIKIDFLDSDAQARFAFREAAAQECAARKLMLSFHGETVPRGQQRRWPHIATLEGVKGQEYYLFAQGPTPAFNVNLVFTRNIVGSMDACPCGFELTGTPTSQRVTSNAHEMALGVLFESGWQSMSVSPESMRDNPARGFLKDLPSAWDDIHFVDGYPGEFVVLARRKGKDWWLAGINAGHARDVSIPLSFLKPGDYRVKLYRDAPVSTVPGIDVRVLNCGGVNAVLAGIELWSNAPPDQPVPYERLQGMPAAPPGFHLIASDDCGAPGKQPHLVAGADWKYSAEEVPLSVCASNDPARTVSYSATALRYRFSPLSKTATYKLRVLYLSHNGDRHQSLSVNDRELHGKLTLPKQELMYREFDLQTDDVRALPPDPRDTKILVEDLHLETAKPWRISLPVNGGFGVKFANGAREP